MGRPPRPHAAREEEACGGRAGPTRPPGTRTSAPAALVEERVCGRKHVLFTNRLMFLDNILVLLNNKFVFAGNTIAFANNRLVFDLLLLLFAPSTTTSSSSTAAGAAAWSGGSPPKYHSTSCPTMSEARKAGRFQCQCPLSFESCFWGTEMCS